MKTLTIIALLFTGILAFGQESNDEITHVYAETIPNIKDGKTLFILFSKESRYNGRKIVRSGVKICNKAVTNFVASFSGEKETMLFEDYIKLSKEELEEYNYVFVTTAVRPLSTGLSPNQFAFINHKTNTYYRADELTINLTGAEIKAELKWFLACYNAE